MRTLILLFVAITTVLLVILFFLSELLDQKPDLESVVGRKLQQIKKCHPMIKNVMALLFMLDISSMWAALIYFV